MPEAQMISRRTILFFIIAVTCFGILMARTWEQERPCREWKSVQPQVEVRSSPVSQEDGSVSVAFNPCNVWYELPWLDKSLALGGFAASVAFVISLIQDLARWFRRRWARRCP